MKQQKLFFWKATIAASRFSALLRKNLGLDLETALRLSSSFGGGMGRLREVCGAVSGMFMVAGLKYGYSDPHDKPAKAEHYKRIQDLAAEFRDENGSIVCRELLASSRAVPTAPFRRTERRLLQKTSVRGAGEIRGGNYGKLFGGTQR